MSRVQFFTGGTNRITGVTDMVSSGNNIIKNRGIN